MKRGLKEGAKEGERDREARECGEGTARNESHANAVFDKRVPAVYRYLNIQLICVFPNSVIRARITLIFACSLGVQTHAYGMKSLRELR